MVTRGEIDHLHVDVAEKFTPFLDGACEIAPSPEFRSAWHRRALNEKVYFYLWSKNGRQQVGIRPGSRTTSPVVPGRALNPDWKNGERAWTCWREVWKREAREEFSLDEAAFTFYWGTQSVEPIQLQLFRAEWPQRFSGGNTSAQPHWQIDWPLSDLETVVDGIHFGMAGWECSHLHAGANHVSDHWRKFAEGKTVEILEQWAIRTLGYSLDQIVHFFAKDLI